MQLLKFAIFIGACLIAVSCQKKPTAKPEPKELPVYTINDWKQELLKELPQASENLPQEITPLQVELSTHPYFIVYANMNNNGKPDAVFIETRQEKGDCPGCLLNTTRLYIYEWDNAEWSLLFGLDSKGAYTQKRHWLRPKKGLEPGTAIFEEWDKKLNNWVYLKEGIMHDRGYNWIERIAVPGDSPWECARRNSTGYCIEDTPGAKRRKFHCPIIFFSPPNWGSEELYWSKDNVYKFHMGKGERYGPREGEVHPSCISVSSL